MPTVEEIQEEGNWSSTLLWRFLQDLAGMPGTPLQIEDNRLLSATTSMRYIQLLTQEQRESRKWVGEVEDTSTVFYQIVKHKITAEYRAAKGIMSNWAPGWEFLPVTIQQHPEIGWQGHVAGGGAPALALNTANYNGAIRAIADALAEVRRDERRVWRKITTATGEKITLEEPSGKCLFDHNTSLQIVNKTVEEGLRDLFMRFDQAARTLQFDRMTFLTDELIFNLASEPNGGWHKAFEFIVEMNLTDAEPKDFEPARELVACFLVDKMDPAIQQRMLEMRETVLVQVLNGPPIGTFVHSFLDVIQGLDLDAKAISAKVEVVKAKVKAAKARLIGRRVKLLGDDDLYVYRDFDDEETEYSSNGQQRRNIVRQSSLGFQGNSQDYDRDFDNNEVILTRKQKAMMVNLKSTAGEANYQMLHAMMARAGYAGMPDFNRNGQGQKDRG
jgi:hypothetical protein